MKRISAFIMAAVMLLLAGCTEQTTAAAPAESTDGITTEEITETEKVTEEIIVAPNEDSAVKCWYTHSFTKTDPNAPKDTGLYSYTVYMAKNETESAGFVISASEDKTGLSVEVSELVSEDGSVIQGEVLRQYYINCGGTDYPDPVAPMTDITREFDVAEGKSQAMLIQFNTNKDTAPGRYEGIVSVKCGEDTVKQLRIAVNVWDITLPEGFTSECVMGMGWGDIYRFDPQLGENDYYRIYYDALLDYGVNAYELPYDIRSAEGQAYMSDPRVRSFRVNYSSNDDTMREYYQVLSSNEEWMEKAYFYPYDEPSSVDALNSMAAKCQRIQNLCPGVRIVVPFFVNTSISNKEDQIAFMEKYVDIWCPKSFCFTKKEDNVEGMKLLYNQKQERRFPEFGERMKSFVDEGDDLWWYVCWEPGLPYLNMYVDMTGLQNRLLFWQQKQYNVNGFLYWYINYWSRIENPWNSMATVGTHYETGKTWLSDSVFGDGSLIYPGSEVGVTGPCSSMRLESVRDGLEEFELFTMLEQVSGREAVDSIIAKVSKSIVEFTDDEDAFAAARIELGNALEAALKNK